MNARGAMEIVVATIGLSLGILSTPMFSIIVIVAIVTSFMAPIGLRLTVPRVRLTDEEQKRMLAAQSAGNVDPASAKVLLATAGGPNALAAVPLGLGLARRSHSPLRILHVNAPAGVRQRLRRVFGLEPAAADISQQREQVRLLAAGQPYDTHEVTAADVAASVLAEAGRGFDLLLLGSGVGPAAGGAVVEEIVSKAPCHIGVMKAVKPATSYAHLFVPIDGSGASRLAAEVALRLAESLNASLTLALVTERRPQAAAYVDESGTYAHAAIKATPDDELDRISLVFRATSVKPSIVRLEYDPLSSAVAREAANGTYDLVVLGAENRAIQHRLFLGYENERLIRSTRVSVLVIVPNVARLH
jgi:nucleotide-binding universal stress UspA family protein